VVKTVEEGCQTHSGGLDAGGRGGERNSGEGLADGGSEGLTWSMMSRGVKVGGRETLKFMKL
jgi:hypothetical protein